MLDLFVNSLRNSGHNMINVNHNNSNFGIGLSFPPVDLSNQKFNIQINSETNSLNTNPYIIYQYFHSFVSI
jgi:Flp pilus assembly secretin CpaC